MSVYVNYKILIFVVQFIDAELSDEEWRIKKYL